MQELEGEEKSGQQQQGVRGKQHVGAAIYLSAHPLALVFILLQQHGMWRRVLSPYQQRRKRGDIVREAEAVPERSGWKKSET
jgi:hypothetical protein